MILQKLCFSSSRFLIAAMLVLGSVDIAAGQKERKVTLIDGQRAEVRTLTEIPEATEPCAPAECEWWNQIRKANSDLNLAYKKRDEKSKFAAKERFSLLLHERREKAYRIPVKDRPPQKLITAWPRYPYVAQKNRIQGKVHLLIDIGNDGLVGDIQVINGPGWGLNESAIQSTRQELFLPAIKDGDFVAYKAPVEVGFGCVGCRKW